MPAKTCVVYVEDNEDNFLLVQRLLQASGEIEVIPAIDGITGLQVVQEHRPALVLLDLDIPLLSGLDLAQRIKADPDLQHIPLIAVSANVMRGERQACLDAGCVAFVEKPFDIIVFRDLVHAQLATAAASTTTDD